jgi:hypothetical protein
MLIEAVIDAFKIIWEKPRFYVFVCAGDCSQVSLSKLKFDFFPTDDKISKFCHGINQDSTYCEM